MPESERNAYRQILGEAPGWTGVDPGKKLKSVLVDLGQAEQVDFDQLGASKGGKRYTPSQWYIIMPNEGKPVNTTVNELRNDVQGGATADKADTVRSLAELVGTPGQLDAFHKNFPDLADEVDINALRAASEAKAAGNSGLAQEIMDAREEFLNTWMKRDLGGPDPVTPDQLQQQEDDASALRSPYGW